MILIFTILILAAVASWILPGIAKALQSGVELIRKRTGRSRNPDIFDNNYIEVKKFFVQEFGTMPCISFMSNMDVTQVFDYINTGNAGKVLELYQSSFYSWQCQHQAFSKTVFKLENKVMIELGHDYAEILFTADNYTYSETIVTKFLAFKAAEKQQPFEINIITITNNALELKPLEIKSTQLDLSLYYNDDFIEVDKVIRRRLEQENDKGIILLHGLPGTGKTTYLRHLIGGMKKKVLFLSPGVAENLMNPEFLDLLIDNPNSVLVIEDAENIIMDRRFNNNCSVSNLLNISDGLLSDCLNVQIICTFNNPLSTVDAALLRKGRLIAKYEFNKLDTAKAQKLSDHLGYTNQIERPMTIAEIANPDDMEVAKPSVQVLGFRREALMN